jgi:hypothetical protein
MMQDVKPDSKFNIGESCHFHDDFTNRYLVTIERISGCLIQMYYDQSSDKQSLSILPLNSLCLTG